MFLTRFSLSNPIAVTLFYMFIVLVGITAFMRMGRSILPPVSLPIVTIAVPYPGAGPAEIERLVIEPVEDQLQQLPDLDRVSAAAQNGIAEISVRFTFGSNLEVARSNVQQAVDAARPNMPTDLVPPIVSRDDPSQSPILEESVNSAILSPTAIAVLIDREIIPALRSTSGVGAVVTTGVQSRQLTVAPRLDALDALGATLTDVFAATARANDILPGGRVRSGGRESTVGIDASASRASTIGTVPIRIPGAGTVRVQDVANVLDGNADQTLLSRVDGDAAVVIFVSRRSGSDAITTIENVRRTFSELERRYPKLRLVQLRSDAPSTAAAVGGVEQTLAEGVLLTVLVMLLFLHAWRNAVIAAISIPTSLFAALLVMWGLGFSLNVLSLMGLSLTIGILVDDSIVIIEAITRNAHLGLRGDDAALAGRRELGDVAIAITLVDVAVFGPIALMNGIIGEFMREFGLVIVLATAFSLLVSLTLTPLLAARWALKDAHNAFEHLELHAIRRALEKQSKLLPWTLRSSMVLGSIALYHSGINAFNSLEYSARTLYCEYWLRVALGRSRTIMTVVALTCLFAIFPIMNGGIPTEFSPPVNRGDVRLDLTFPAGTPLQQSDRGVQRLSSVLLENPEVKHVVTIAGRAFNGSSDIFASNVAQLNIVLTDPNSLGSEIVATTKALQRLIPGASVAGAGRGMGGTAAIRYNLTGTPDAVDAAAQKLASALREIPGAIDVRLSNGGRGPRKQISVSPGKALLLNVSPDDVAQTARLATGGAIAMKARLPDGLVDVVVQSDAARHGDVDALGRFSVRASDSRLVPLSAVTTVRNSEEPTVIERENRERVVSVSANTLEAVPIGAVTTAMQKHFNDPSFLPAGARIAPRGDVEQFFDTVAKMMAAFALSVLAVYAILAMLYRSYVLPLVIMATVPLSAIGAFGSLYLMNVLHSVFPNASLLTGQTLNLYSMLGMIMLVGLVAKNGILLVEYAEREVRAGRSAAAAMQIAGERRFRPILMTTFAMIAGMMPLALGQAIGAEYRKALGTVVIGGLSSSLLLTLFVVPIVYVALRAKPARKSRSSPVQLVASPSA